MHKTVILFTAVLFFSTAVFSLDVKTEYSHIYSDDEGSSNLWAFQVEDRFDDGLKDQSLSYNLNYNVINSTLQQINGTIHNVNFSSSVRNKLVQINARSGFLSSSKIKIKAENTFSNDGANGYYFGLESPFKIYDFSVKPAAYFGCADFSSGDMAYFMGHPEFPYFMLFGLDFDYQKNHLQLMCAPFKINILTNDSKELFSSDNFLTGLMYSRKFDFYVKDVCFNFEPFSAYYFAAGNLQGALTQENQRVIYFVFDYFNVDSVYNLHAVAAGSNGNIKYKFLKINFDTALLFFLYENCDINLSWKKLDGLAQWQETLVWNSLNMEKTGSSRMKMNELDKTGLLVFNLGAEAGFLQNRGKVYFKKKVLIPFTINNTVQEKQTSKEITMDANLIRNILLSGISLGVSVWF